MVCKMINKSCYFPDRYDKLVSQIIQQMNGLIMKLIPASWMESFLNLLGGWYNWPTSTVLPVIVMILFVPYPVHYPV